jgi:aspartate oxidase
VLTGEAPSAIHWLEELGVEFTRENGGYRLARCGGASRKRLLQVGDRTGHAITKALREAWEAARHDVPEAPLRELERARTAGARAAASTVDAATVVLAAGGRCYARPRSAASSRRTIRRDRRGDADRARPRRGGARPRRAPVPPERRRLAANMQGYSIPETTRAYGAVLLNADGEEFTDSLGPRDEVSQAIFDEVEQGAASRRRRPARGLPRHDAHRARRRESLAAVHAAPLPRGGIDPLAEPILTYPSSTTRTAAS